MEFLVSGLRSGWIGYLNLYGGNKDGCICYFLEGFELQGLKCL